MSITARRLFRSSNKKPIPASNVTVEAIIADSFGNHDAVPRGVPDGYSWKYSSENNPNVSYTGYTAFGAVNTWGQVFTPATGSANYNVRLQCRDPRVWFLRTAAWESAVIPSGSPGAMGGAYWAGNFDPNASQNAAKRDEGGGVWSVSLSPLATPPIDVFHYWWDGMYPRIAVPSDCRGIVVRTDMRIVPDDGYITVNGAQFIGGVDCDLFANQNTITDPKGWNDGLPEGRMKWLTDTWTRYYNTTLSIAALRAEPPPDN